MLKNENQKHLLKIINQVYIDKGLTFYDNLKKAGFNYLTVKAIDEKIKKELEKGDERNDLVIEELAFSMHMFFRDLNFFQNYYEKLKALSQSCYMTHNFSLEEMLLIEDILFDEFNGSFGYHYSLDAINTCFDDYFRAMLNCNTISLSSEDCELLQSLIAGEIK